MLCIITIKYFLTKKKFIYKQTHKKVILVCITINKKLFISPKFFVNLLIIKNSVFKRMQFHLKNKNSALKSLRQFSFLTKKLLVYDFWSQ